MTQPANDFGTCWSWVTDMTSPSRMASGFQVVGEAIARRWLTAPGQLVNDPTYGENVYNLLSDDLSPRDIAYAQQRLAAQAMRDERVLRAQVTVSLAGSGLLSINALITTAAGPFKMVFSLSSGQGVSLLVSP